MSNYPTKLNFIYERNQNVTIYVGNIDQKYPIVNSLGNYSLICPVLKIYLSRDHITGQHPDYDFIEFKNEVDAEYAIKKMHIEKL